MPTRQYTKNRIDYEYLYRFFNQHVGQIVGYEQFQKFLEQSPVNPDDYAAYRKALVYVSNPLASAVSRQKHGFKGLVLRFGRGKFVYDPDAAVDHTSTPEKTVVTSPALLYKYKVSAGTRISPANSTYPEVALLCTADIDAYKRRRAIANGQPVPPPVAATVTVEPDPPVEPKGEVEVSPQYALAEVMVDSGDDLVLRTETGAIIVATVKVRAKS